MQWFVAEGLVCEQRIVLHCCIHLLANFCNDLFVFWWWEDGVDELCDELHHVFLRATGCHGSCSETDTAGLECWATVERNHVLVDGDVGCNECVLCHLTSQFGELAAEVEQHGVVICSAADDVEATVDECCCECCCVFLHLCCVFLPAWLKVFAECHGLGSDESAYDLIMKDKERLLNFDEPTRFIFSHSALREGWDNPNVFQICTLKNTANEIGKRQEVGRGMRLCVNKDGERQDADMLGNMVFDTNILTVIASESYEQFSKQLQHEISEVVSDRLVVITPTLFIDIMCLRRQRVRKWK